MVFKSDEIFDKIKARVAKIDGTDRTVLHVYKFVITVDGAAAKTWILDLKDLKVYESDDAAVDATLTISDEDMLALGSGTLTAKDALQQEKLDIDGDYEAALKLSPFISSL